MSAPMSKLEYLKKYMSSTKTEEKKVKKRKLKPLLKAKGGIKIVDEEIDLKKIAAGFEKDEDALETQEDAPFIAGVVDERSVELKTKQDFIESSKWKRLGVDDNEQEQANSSQQSSFSSKQNRKHRTEDSTTSSKFVKVKVEKPDYDFNPSQRHQRRDSDSDPSPPRKRHDSDSDPSPPRRRHDSESDHSPLRMPKSDTAGITARKRHNSDDDPSPPRKNRLSDSDQSPPRKNRHSDSDQSPPRKHRHRDSDQSPPRKHRHADSDRRKRDSRPDLSPQRRKDKASEVRVKRDPDGDLSPERPSRDSQKLSKTLDGKRAGLQTGRALREETEEFRRKEDEAFRKLDKSLTGENATTAIRAGKLRQIEAKQEKEREKAEKLAKIQEAYQKWNKGLKQTESQSTKLAEDLYEMSKPMARFADDEDLERMQREAIHADDPMAAYMTKKRAKKEADGKGKAPRPVYRGPAAAPNRFGILPGYRWDGVDRSNGFEKMYFEKQNRAIAIQEEAYKWSVSDM